MKKYIKRFIVALSSVLVVVSGLYIYKTVQDILSYTTTEEELINIVWYQVGEEPVDLEIVEPIINAYTKRIGVTVERRFISEHEYELYMEELNAEDEIYDLVFTSEWIYNYQENALNGMFYPIDELLTTKGNTLINLIDETFWQGVLINGETYGVPTQKESAYIPMLVYNKEYVETYNLPYNSITDIKQLEEYFEIVSDSTNDIIPFVITKDFTPLNYFDEIVPGVGIDYRNSEIVVEKIYESESMLDSLTTMNRYFVNGYINDDASIINDTRNLDALVVIEQGYPYLQYDLSRAWGYDVIARNALQNICITNKSTQYAITAISANSNNPEKAMELLTLVNNDVYLMNLMVYGIEGVHYKKTDTNTIQLLERSSDYQVTNYMQGNLYLLYTIDGESKSKWVAYQEMNEKSTVSNLLGFTFDITPVKEEIEAVTEKISIFAPGLNTGTLDPKIYLNELNRQLAIAGIDQIVDEVNRQVDEWLEQQPMKQE